MESERIRILLEKQKEQILAEVRIKIHKHEVQADCDRRNIPKLNGVRESQRGEIIVLVQETNNFDEIINFFMNIYHNKIENNVKLM